MEIVPSTFLSLAAIALLFRLGPYKGLWAFMVVAPFGAAAAFNLPAVGGATIGQLEFAICALMLTVFLMPQGPNQFFGTLRPGQAGFWLLLLILYCLLSSFFFPRIFAGQTEIFSLSRALNTKGIISVPLQPTNGNISQSMLFLLAALCFVALATLFRVRPDEKAVLKALMIVTSVNFILGWLDVITFAAGMEALLEPIRTANYDMLINHRMAGIKRMIGGMPEASSFGAFSLGLFGIWMHYWITGPKTPWVTVMFAMATISVLRSTSSGAYVAVVALLAIYSIGWALLAGRGKVSPRAAVLIFAGVIGFWICTIIIVAGYQLVETITMFFDNTLLNKLDSDSGVERGSWNTQAYANFTDTWFLGAGLGSVRASNWFLACLGSIGVIGTAFYFAFLASIARAPAETGNDMRDAIIQSLKIGCLALLIAALLTAPTPNLGTFFYVLAGLSVGLSRSAFRGAVPSRRFQTPFKGHAHAA